MRAEEKNRCFLKAINKRLVEVTIIETSSLAVEIVERMRAGEICMIVVEELLVGVQLEIVANEKLREEERKRFDLAALQLSGTHILMKRKRSRKSKYKVQTVQGSCVTCTEVGEGDSFSKRRFCASHRTAEENISSLTRVVEICPPTRIPSPYRRLGRM